jgi:dihydropyrimidine dehydrogenase (NAD+) subunit PreA
MGFNNIELITDRPLEVNLREIAEVKKRYPKHAVIVSLMVESQRGVARDHPPLRGHGRDGLELNFGCPHGMCERGMGSAVGQEPEGAHRDHLVGEGVREHPRAREAHAQHRRHSRTRAYAAVDGNCDGLSLINTIKSIVGVDLDRMVPLPRVGGGSRTAATAAPPVKPIALHMIAQLARDPKTARRAHLGHRRHLQLARRGGVHRARLHQRAGVHRGDAPRVTASSRT